MKFKVAVNKTLDWMDNHEQEVLWGAYITTLVVCFAVGYKHGSRKELGSFWTWTLGPAYKLGKYLGK